MNIPVMMERNAEAPAHPRARVAGVVYLLFFVTAVLGGLFVRGLVVSGDAAATANNLQAHESLFRLGFATNLLATAFYIAVTALFYELFKPVNRSLSLLAAFFSLVGCVILAFSYLFDLAPFVFLGGAQYSSVFKVEQLQSLALMSLNLQPEAENISLVFFGLYDLLIGYLILPSTFLPRILGGVMAVAGLGWLMLLSPLLARHLSSYILVLGFLAEFALCLWLLVMGVNIPRWKEQAESLRFE
jgi:hypothetical protein